MGVERGVGLQSAVGVDWEAGGAIRRQGLLVVQ
jgi:hypothetical protein